MNPLSPLRRFRRARTARLLLLAVLLAGAVQPARAQEPPAPVPYDLDAIVAAQEAALSAPADVLPAQATAFPLAAVGLPLEGPLLIDGGLPGVHSAQAADFDRDGDLDIVAAERTTGRLLWYRNNGASGASAPFFEPHLIAQVSGAYYAHAADLNGDGSSDIVLLAVGVVDSDDAPADGKGSALWFRNDGATGDAVPTFAQRTLAAGLNYPVHGATADLDGDGDLDLAVASTADDTIRWFANSGGSDPTFAPRLVAQGADGAVAVAVGDMDRDGDVDVVSASENDDRIVLHANDGGGNFAPVVVRPGAPQPGMDFAKSVALADLDQDGDLDVVYGSEGQNEVGWYESDGSRPPRFTHHILTSERDHVKFVAAADIDQDGDIDIFSASSDDGTFAWFRNEGGKPPQFTQQILTSSAAGARYVFPADMDGDGDLDLLTAARGSGHLAWFRNQSLHRTGHFPATAQSTVGVFAEARHVESGDLDGDGDLDLVAVGDTLLFWYDNDGKQPAAFTPHSIPTSVVGGRWVDLGDLDHDGDLDFVMASTQSDRLYWYENDGGRPPTFSERLLSADFFGPRAVLLADVDKDGRLDPVVVADGNADGFSRVAWLKNDGARPPGFSVQIVDTDLAYARALDVGDVDHDGDVDFAIADSVRSRYYLYENLWTNQPGVLPTFARHDVGPGDGAQGVHLADIDGDGDLDVFGSSERDDRITLFENLDRRGSTFFVHTVDAAADGAHAVFAADADGDGDLDLIGANEYSNAVVWYEHNGSRPPAFTPHTLSTQAFGAHSTSAADLDGDGDLDLLATAKNSGQVLIFGNLSGQFRLSESGFTLGTRAVLGVRVQHLGRSGDPALEVALLEISFVGADNALLSPQAIAGRVRALSIYADSDGNGRFDPAADRLLGTETRLTQATNGRLALPLTLADPPLRVEPGGAALLFAVADLGGVCDTGNLRLSARATGQTALDALAGRPLLPEGSAAIGGSPVAPVDPQRFLRINEISANNQVDDWLEVYNTGPYTVDMGGMYLTDSLDNPTKHRLPAGIRIPPFGFLVFIADETPGPFHLDFALSSNGESVGLFDSDVRTNRVLDTVTFGPQPEGRVSGRMPDGGPNWRLLPAASPGSANALAGLSLDLFLPTIRKNAGC